MKLVETPPGPPVIATSSPRFMAAGNSYEDLLSAADTVESRLAVEPGVVDVDSVRERPSGRSLLSPTRKSRLKRHHHGANRRHASNRIGSGNAGVVRNDTERNPLRIELACPWTKRSSAADLAKIQVKGSGGQLVPLAELGRWDDTRRVDQMIYHKNLQRRGLCVRGNRRPPPADVVMDVMADKTAAGGQWSVACESPMGKLQISKISNQKSLILRSSGRLSHLLSQRRRRRLEPAGGLHGRFRRRRRVEDHARCVPRLGLGLRRGDDRHLRAAWWPNRLVRLPLVVMLAISTDDSRRDAGLLAAEAASAEQVGGFWNPVYFTATGMIGMIPWPAL